MLTTAEKFCKVLIYGALGTACIAGLIVALAYPDHLDAIEAQLAGVYLALLIGSNKAFNAKPICGYRMLGAIATFTGAGLSPATIIHVAIVQVVMAEVAVVQTEPVHNAHVAALQGHALVLGLAAFLTIPFSLLAVKIWQACEEKQNPGTETSSS